MKQQRYGGVEIHLVISSVQCKWNGPHLSMVLHACKCMLGILHFTQKVKTLLIFGLHIELQQATTM